MKKKLTILFLGFCGIIYSQKTLTGRISDANNQALNTVLVTIPELHKTTISDENGTYILQNLPFGSFTIIFSFDSFETQTIEFKFLEKTPLLNIVLIEKSHQMDEVIVSTAFNKVQSQNVMKVEHQTMKSLKQKGALTLIEGLATIPGVSQIATGVSIGKPVIRGLSGNRVLVYSQGVRLENQQFGEEHGLGLNDSGIESVEVIKGPASLLYGSDAIGGVLYFNPEKFAKPNSNELHFNQKYFSNTNASNTSLGYKLSGDDLKFSTRINKSSHSDYKVSDGNRVTNSRFNELDFKSGLGYSNSVLSTVIRFNFNKLDLGIPEEGFANQSLSKKPEFPKQVVETQIFSWNSSFYFKNSKLDADFGYIANDRGEFDEKTIANLQMKLKTFNYNIKYYLPRIKALETIIGTQGMSQTNTNFGKEYLIPDAFTNDFGIFATSNYKWNKYTIQVGMRYDKRKVATSENGKVGQEGYFQIVNKQFESNNYSLGFKTNLKDNLIFRANLASGFRAPNLAELTSNGVHEGSNRYEIGNSNLQNEQNFQSDLNLEYRNSHVELFANGFYNLINNYIFISPNGNSIESNDVYDYLQTNAKLYGGEAGIHFHPHPLDWLHVTSSFESVSGKQQNGANIPLIPANKWNNSFKIEFKPTKYLKDSFAVFSVDHTFNQRRPSQFESTSLDYTLLNLGLGTTVTLKKLVFEINFNITNLFDKKYISHLSRLKTDEIPNIGRNIIFGIDFKI